MVTPVVVHAYCGIHSAKQKQEQLLTHTTTWMNCQGIMVKLLKPISKDHTLYISLFQGSIENGEQMRNEKSIGMEHK